MRVELQVKDEKELHLMIQRHVEHVVRKIVKDEFNYMIKTAVEKFITKEKLESTLNDKIISIISRYATRPKCGFSFEKRVTDIARQLTEAQVSEILVGYLDKVNLKKQIEDAVKEALGKLI